MSEELARFWGVWVLDPTQCRYGDTPVPQSGVYTILPEEDHLWFHIRWRDAEGKPQETSFRASFTEPRTIGEASANLVLTMRMEDGALVTELSKDDTPIHTAWRRADGNVLNVHQRMVGPSGVTNTHAVYGREETKQVLVYRRDLNMRKGKIAAQCAHASMAVFFERDIGPVDKLVVPIDGPMASWSKGRFAKVVLSVETEADLIRIHEIAREAAIPTALITDSGRTEFNGQPTRTTVAVGPAAASEVDRITGPEGQVPTKLA